MNNVRGGRNASTLAFRKAAKLAHQRVFRSPVIALVPGGSSREWTVHVETGV